MKKMKLLTGKWVALSLFLVAFQLSVASGQTGGLATVSITSKPSGVTVIMEGDQTVAGITPTVFSQKLMGFYRISAHRAGYESYHSSVVLSGHEATSIDIQLSPKTRLKSGIRSLIIPGWGQIYHDSKTKGVLFTLMAASAGVTTGFMHLHYASLRDDYFVLKDKFDATRSVTEREAQLAPLYAAQKKAYDAQRRRNVAIGVLAGVWALNFIDAVVLFPDYGVNISGASISLAPDFNNGGVGVKGMVKF